MIEKINAIKERIELLKKSLEVINREIASLESHIDTLECYPSRKDHVDNLYEETNSLEKSKEDCKKELLELYKVMESIARFEELNDKRTIIEEEMKDNKDSTKIFELGSIKLEMDYIEGNVDKTINELKNKR